jgi:hypothetical protein
MLTLIDTAVGTVKESLTRFVENGFESNPDELSGALVTEVSRGLEQSLDESWDMQGQRYAMAEVVENILWCSAEVPPGKLEQFCERMCRFKPSEPCIQGFHACQSETR